MPRARVWWQAATWRGAPVADMRRVGSDEGVAYIPSDERCRPGSPTPARRLHWTVYAVVTVVLFSVACSAQAFRAMLPSAHYVVSAKPSVTETMLRSSAIHWQRKASQEPVIPPAQQSAEPVIPPAQRSADPVIPPAQQSAQQWEWAGFAQLPSHIVKEATWFDEERTLPALFKDVPEGGIVWMSFANKAFETLTYNWAAHVYMLRKERQLVLASLDGALQVQLRRHRLPFFSFSMAGTTSADLRSNVTEFRLMGALKGELLLSVLNARRNVLLSDVDVIWLADPEPLLRTLWDADVMSATDCLSPIADDERAPPPERQRQVRVRVRVRVSQP